MVALLRNEVAAAAGGASAASDTRDERIAIIRPSGVPEALVVAADDSTRKWREVHHHYTVATVLEPRRGALSQGEVHYREWRYFTEPGVLMLMEPGELHATKKVTGVATFRLLQIDPALVCEAAEGLDLPTPVHWRAPSCNDPALYGSFVKLHALIEHGGTAEEQEAQFVSSLRALLLAYAERRGSAKGRDFTRIQIHRALGYIQARYQQRVTLADLACLCGVSRFRVDQLFSGAVGISPIQYQLELRVAEARRLLAAGRRPGEIAHELGFYDHSQFSKLFKRSVGVSPIQYADALRSKMR